MRRMSDVDAELDFGLAASFTWFIPLLLVIVLNLIRTDFGSFGLSFFLAVLYSPHGGTFWGDIWRAAYLLMPLAWLSIVLYNRRTAEVNPRSLTSLTFGLTSVNGVMLGYVALFPTSVTEKLVREGIYPSVAGGIVYLAISVLCATFVLSAVGDLAGGISSHRHLPEDTDLIVTVAAIFVIVFLSLNFNLIYLITSAQHYHGTIAVEVDGEEVDLTQDRYQFQNEAFHLEEGNGRVWHAHVAGVTVEFAIAALRLEAGAPGTSRAKSRFVADREYVVKPTLNGAAVDPATTVLSESDHLKVVLERTE